MKKHSILLIFIITMSVLCFSLFTGCKKEDSLYDDDPYDVSSYQTALEPDTSKLDIVESTKDYILNETINCRYFDQKDFMSSVKAVDQNKLATPSTGITGGIVPHHLLAGKMIAEFFSYLSESSPDTIIILAPNHREVGVKSIHTSALAWGTAFGVVEADIPLIDSLIENLGASQNTLLMEEEHSISSLVPYISYYMPDTKIVPVLLHGNHTKKASLELGETLSDFAERDSRTVIIASVDFSHYLDAEAALKMDQVTLEAIKSNDIDAIFSMGNDNLDSPPSIIALLKAMENMGADDLNVFDHGNSSYITGRGADYTTSYYTIFFTR